MIARLQPRADGHRARVRTLVPAFPRRAAVACALLAAACALAIATGCARTAAPLRVGINAEPGYEFAYLAQVRGLYEREHVNVQLVQFESMSDSRRAFERGQLDGYFATVFEVLQARANSGRRPRIVRVLDCSQGYDVVLARPGISGVADLRDCRVAVEPGSLNVYLLARAMQLHGLEPNTLRMVGMDATAMNDALRRGDVDAVVSYPPAATRIVNAGLAHPVFSSADIPGEVVDVLAFDDAVLDARASDVAAFVRGYDGAVAWMAGHRDEACRIMAAREGVSVADFEASLDGGLELVSASQQDAFTAPGGLLSRVIGHTSSLLVGTDQLPASVAAADVLPRRGGM